MPALVVTKGGEAGLFVPLAKRVVVVGRDQAAAIAIILHLVDFGPAAVCGLFYFLRGEISLARLRELMKPEAVEHAVEDEKIVPAKVFRQGEA